MSNQRLNVQPRATDKHYDVAGFIGRFQIFTLGHRGALLAAFDLADTVAVLVGSANRARDTRNSFTFQERERQIRGGLRDYVVEQIAATSGDPAAVTAANEALQDRLKIMPLNDAPYDKPAWINSVNTLVRSATTALRPRVCLIGHKRDETSEYLDWFPAWDFVPSADTGIAATPLRSAYFAGNVDFDAKGWTDTGIIWKDVVPFTTIQFLREFRDDPHYTYLMQQKAAEENYRAKWGIGPFQTVDPVVRKGDHVLMIERGGLEGTGSIGLPGGFLKAGQTLLDGALDEAIEETALFIRDEDLPGFRKYLAEAHRREMEKLPRLPQPQCMLEAKALLSTYLKGRGERFDDPYRSRRGHLITEAFLFELPGGHGLPRVVGCDDAKRAFWMPISEVRPDNSFEDHAFLIDRMLALYA